MYILFVTFTKFGQRSKQNHVLNTTKHCVFVQSTINRPMYMFREVCESGELHLKLCAILKLLNRIITQGIHRERSRLRAVSLFLEKPQQKSGKNANEQRAAKLRAACSARVSRLTTPALLAARSFNAHLWFWFAFFPRRSSSQRATAPRLREL